MKELLEEYKIITTQICQIFEIVERPISIQLDMNWEFADNNIDAISTFNEFYVYDDFIEYDEIHYKHDFVLLTTTDNIAIILDKNKQIKE